MSDKIILVVEDEDTSRNVLVQALETLGYGTKSAVNGREALDVMAVNKVDLILTDVYMPELNGLELLQTVRENGNMIPVILVTGFDASEAHQFAQRFDAYALLPKPFRLTQLKQILEEAFDGKFNINN